MEMEGRTACTAESVINNTCGGRSEIVGRGGRTSTPKTTNEVTRCVLRADQLRDVPVNVEIHLQNSDDKAEQLEKYLVRTCQRELLRVKEGVVLDPSISFLSLANTSMLVLPLTKVRP